MGGLQKTIVGETEEGEVEKWCDGFFPLSSSSTPPFLSLFSPSLSSPHFVSCEPTWKLPTESVPRAMSSRQQPSQEPGPSEMHSKG
jgi:hypothetical protein